MLGCGNAKFSEEMYEDGYRNITNVDISSTVIKQMNEYYKQKIPDMTYEVMDAREMSFEDGSFDCIIDKACFDALLSGDNSGPNSAAMLNEVHRVLAPNGVYMSISYGVPNSRLGYFEKKELFEWANNVTVHKAAKPYINTAQVISEGDKNENSNFHFLYIMQKAGGGAPQAK